MLFKEFRDQRRKPDLRRGLPDLLNYAYGEDDETIMMKDGARLSAFACAGPDLNSASIEELDAHRALANRALIRLDESFAWQIDYVRHSSAPRPKRTFLDPVSSLMGHEGDLIYAQEGRHFERTTVLSIACRRLSDSQAKLGGVFVSGGGEDREREREWYKQQLQDFADAMSPALKLRPLGLSELLSHITSCINGHMCVLKAPRGALLLDAVLGNQDFVTGTEPRIGGRHIRVISLSGLPLFSHAELALFLQELPLSFRYSIRALPQGLRASVGQLGVVRRNWFQKRKGLRAIISESIGTGAGAAFDNQHALKMAGDADDAIAEAEGGEVRFCYATAKIVITAGNRSDVREAARLIFKTCQNMGFDPRIETYNATEAWLGSIPIHGWYDVRKPLVSARNVADIMPLTSVWPGLAANPCPYYPQDTPALCYGATTGGTPWRFNLHVTDTGHTLLIGPTGSGKSVALGFIAANARALPRMQVFFMDKGCSAFVLTKALGGQHLDLGEEDVPLQPLARIDDPTDRMKVQTLLESWIAIRNVKLAPAQTKALYRGLSLLAEAPVEQRTITNLITQVQDPTVRSGLSPYSLSGQLGSLLDADRDVLLQFYNAGVHYSAAVQPYAIKLFFALFLIDIIVTWIQYSAEGQLDPSFFLGRILKHVLSGGFVYLMIVNGFAWMYIVIQSFSRIGAAISGLPALSPQSVLQAGMSMTTTLLNSPTTSGMVSSLELALVEGFCVFAVGAAFLIVAVELLLTLVRAYLTTGLGVILLGFGGNRFTASASEGYFTNVIRIGVKLLFFYAVLSIAMQMVAQWQADLEGACKPVTAAVPVLMSYFVPPSKMMTTVCSGTIPLTNMLYYVALAVVFAVVCVAVPTMAADLVGGTIALALAHAFEAAYTAQTIARVVNPVTAGLKKVSDGISSLANGRRDPASNEQEAIRTLVADPRRGTATETANAATTVLDPFTGRRLQYYNGSTSQSATALPSPNGGASGQVPEASGTNRPGQYTKNIAIDISDFKNGNGGGS